jgi:hypothetical protein
LQSAAEASDAEKQQAWQMVEAFAAAPDQAAAAAPLVAFLSDASTKDAHVKAFVEALVAQAFSQATLQNPPASGPMTVSKCTEHSGKIIE